MASPSIKVVRPWPAEQPRPPLTHRTERSKATRAGDRQPPAKPKAA